MLTPDSSSVLRILREAADFTRTVGAESEAAQLERFYVRFQSERATFKLLQGPVDKAMSQAFRKARAALFDEKHEPLPGTDSLRDKYGCIWEAFFKLIYPPDWLEMDITQFAGSEHLKQKVVSYKGVASGVLPVVERSIELIQRYSRLIGRGDFESAYLLTAAGLRGWMSLKRFVTEHEQAARTYGGPALEYLIHKFQFVYSDDAARRKSTADEGWPKATPKQERRSCVTGFWIRDRDAQTGCAGGFLISEERHEYRIAKFTFYRP
jgi:hypothetical protein